VRSHALLSRRVLGFPYFVVKARLVEIPGQMRACTIWAPTFDCDGGGFAAADAERGDAAAEIALLERREQRDENARAGCADGMAERAGAAVDVDFVVGQAEIAHGGHATTAKASLISNKIDIARDQPVRSSSTRIAPMGAVGKSAACWRRWSGRDDASGLRPRRSASERRMRTSAAAPSEMALEFAAVTVPPSRKAGLRWDFVGRGFERELVVATIRSVLPALTVRERFRRRSCRRRWLFARG
jgi:hypothetical protein